jgi:hypothetical protein
VILANIPTTLGGGNHGHAGILMDPARYLLTAGVPFANPANPGNTQQMSQEMLQRESEQEQKRSTRKKRI